METIPVSIYEIEEIYSQIKELKKNKKEDIDLMLDRSIAQVNRLMDKLSEYKGEEQKEARIRFLKLKQIKEL